MTGCGELAGEKYGCCCQRPPPHATTVQGEIWAHSMAIPSPIAVVRAEGGRSGSAARRGRAAGEGRPGTDSPERSSVLFRVRRQRSRLRAAAGVTDQAASALIQGPRASPGRIRRVQEGCGVSEALVPERAARGAMRGSDRARDPVRTVGGQRQDPDAGHVPARPCGYPVGCLTRQVGLDNVRSTFGGIR